MSVTNPAALHQNAYATCLKALGGKIDTYTGDAGIGILLVSVENMSKIYTAHGHRQGDRVMKQFGSMLSDSFPERDEILQVSENRLAIILGVVKNEGHAILAANQVMRIGVKAMESIHSKLELMLCIGIAINPLHAEEEESLLQCSELALQIARDEAQPYAVYSRRTATSMSTHLGLESNLAQAIEQGDLSMNYQPKIAVKNQRLAGAEALMRWHHGELGDVQPDIFIGVAERIGQIVPLTRIAIQSAARQLSEWRNSITGLNIAVNVTPSIINGTDIIEMIQSAIRFWAVDPSALTIEVTEEALMVDPGSSHEILTTLRDFGVRISIDDFGTGYSSLSYLKSIPADEIKVDKSFVLNMQNDSADYKIVEHIVALARAFNLEVVAEGVENEAILQEIIAIGVDYAQGYHYSRALTPDDFEGWATSFGLR